MMKKTYKIDVDCANCANLMEAAANKVAAADRKMAPIFVVSTTPSMMTIR